MIFWTTLGAALALLAWRLGRQPSDAMSLGPVLVVAAVLVAAAVSNRAQRRLRALAARAMCRFWFGRRERLSLVEPLERLRTLPELLDRLPRVTASVAGVEPVTAFALDEDGNQYLPVSSTLLTTPCAPVAADDPLAEALRRVPRVHYLKGRTDDLENAPIYAVNGDQVEECQAACALPLRRNGTLVGFLMCGRTEGSPRLGLLSSGRLEELGQRYATMVDRCAGSDVTIAGRLDVNPVVSQRSVSA
jgi:hypothetical protein